MRTDHLGSATLATDIGGSRVGELRYTPYGVTRYEWGNTPTNRRYTGQPWEGFGLYDYGARMYSPGLGRWASADTMVPDPLNPQSLNRYAYVLNNPMRYIDPTGNDPLGSDWLIEFQQRHRRDPEWYDRAIRLFSIAFPEEWSWGKFYDGYGNLQSENVLANIFKDVTAEKRCWGEMPNVFERLTQWYEPAEEAFFVHDIAFLFAGIASRFENDAMTAVTKGQIHQNVYLRSDGINVEFSGTRDPDANVHHWAWAFLMGYTYGSATGTTINWLREQQQGWGGWSSPLTVNADSSDVKIGEVGSMMGGVLRSRYDMDQTTFLFHRYPRITKDYGTGRSR